MNIGEEICGEWLRHIQRCDFVQYNLKTSAEQGEIDVIGLNLQDQRVYACEVAVHLITGLQYVKYAQPDNVNRLCAKFGRDIRYVRNAFPGYEHSFMLWSPIVKNSRAGSKNNQVEDVKAVVERISEEFGVAIQPVINEQFKKALDELRVFARKETREIESSAVRLLQVEEHLARHLGRK